MRSQAHACGTAVVLHAQGVQGMQALLGAISDRDLSPKHLARNFAAIPGYAGNARAALLNCDLGLRTWHERLQVDKGV